MRKKLKRFLTLSLGAILVTSMFSGCQKSSENVTDTKQVDKDKNTETNFNKTGLPIVKEKETFTIAVSQISSLKAAAEKECVKQAEEKTNIHIEWVEIPASGWNEKTNIMFSTDSLPDAIIGDVDIARNFEQLAVLDDLLKDYAPNVTAFFDTRDDYPNALKAPDGTIRTLPIGDESIHNIIDSHLWINQNWLDKLNLTMPTTPEELKEVLKAFKEKDPNGNGIADEIPFTFRDAWGWGVSIENFFGTYKTPENENHVWLDKDKKVVFSAREEGDKKTLSYLADLYKEGLIDKDAFILSNDQYSSRGATGDILGLVAGYTASEAGVKNEDDFRALPVLTDNGTMGVVGLNNITKAGGFAISKNCKNPEALVRWYDYINSDEKLAMLWGRGPEGVWWDTVKEGDKEYVRFLTMDKEVLAKNGGYSSKPEYRSAESFAGITPSLCRYNYLEELKYDDKWPHDFKLEAVQRDIPFGVKGLPAGSGTLENSERRAILKADIDTYLKKFIADSVLNGIDDKKWEEHINALKSLNIDEYLTLTQEFVDMVK